MSYRILVVDDSAVSRRMVCRAISMSGLDVGRVFDAANGKEALSVLDKEWVDIVFTDIHMPEMDGVELVAQMAEHDMLKALPVVVVSSDRNEEQADALRKRGIRAYVKKPIGPEELRDVIQKIFAPEEGAPHA